MDSTYSSHQGRRLALAAVFAAALSIPTAVMAQSAGAGIGDAMSSLFERARKSDDASKAWNRLRTGDKAALNELVALAKQGNHMAQLYVGYLLDNAEYVTLDSASAAAYFKAAAPQNQLAAYNLGLLYLLGRGVPKDERAAVRLFEQACQKGVVEQAAVRLAQYHLKQGNAQEAWKWAEQAANVGNAFAYFVLGKISFDRGDYRPARMWLEKAAQAGERNAPSLLARLYASNALGQPDEPMAVSWAIIAAVLNGQAPSATQAATGGYGSRLTESEIARARGMATNWLANHGAPQDIHYSKTIYEPRRTF
ncbi:tetratricopeptide repeat protein [Methylibium petroleiphilum]|nr:SEL1-like repeat protein [Methylibium petroleiphilum]